MKKLITLLLGCSLALTAGVQAAKPEDAAKNKKKPVQKQQQFTPKQQQHTAPNARVQTMPKQYKNPSLQNNAKIHTNNGPKHVNTLPAVQPNNPPVVKQNNFKVKPNQPVHDPKPVVGPNQFKVKPNTPVVAPNNLKVNKTVKNFQPKHQNFHARVNPSVASAHFNQNFRIRNAQNWHGAHYNVFRTYRPQWHDRSWWHSHHNHIILIGGGWYFWNAGYWYPAWGYDNSASYYPYDGPIYVGDNPRPFDQVVADVQSVLQEQGYYHGEVDGLVGPLTQEALAAYQSNAGLEQTAAVDQPTLESLGIS
jgi:hypothetical protein